MTMLVTGATGFLGQHLVALLRSEGADVRALARSSTLALERSGVSLCLGDVCDPGVCAEAVRGVRDVFHLAGFVSRRAEDGAALYRVHVDGTRTLLRAARAAGVRRVVVVSTSGTIGVGRDGSLATEASPWTHGFVARWPYYLSKIYQEQTALEEARSGPEVVLVNPSLLLGPGDERGSSTGDVELVVRGRLPMIPKGGGVALVDVRDAARGCALAMQHGGIGERYLLSAANLPLDVFLGRVARLAHVSAPRPLLTNAWMRRAAEVWNVTCGAIGRVSELTPMSVEMAAHTWYVDSSKARQTLGWAPRPIDETLWETVRDIQERHGLQRGAA